MFFKNKRGVLFFCIPGDLLLLLSESGTAPHLPTYPGGSLPRAELPGGGLADVERPALLWGLEAGTVLLLHAAPSTEARTQ